MIVQSPDCKEAVRGIISTGILPDQNSVENATKLITNILVPSVVKAGIPIKNGVLPRRQARIESSFKSLNPTHPKWHDQSCLNKFNNINRV